jgi:tRNA nucleotidyltransferase (CCA-adding enzyme)
LKGYPGVPSKSNQLKKDLTVITTHINADFDAVASMLAAQKLFPDALVVFPGSQEKNLRNFFINSMVYLFNMVNIKDIDFSSVKRLVLVDTKQPGRIGKIASLLDTPDLEIQIYDHHPAMPNDIEGDVEINELTGSTVTILTHILKDKGIDITADEATIMCLGIYEDTGSFTFSSTTEKDFLAAAYLLSRGANLNVVSSLIEREMSPLQVGLLNDMIKAVTKYNINGVDIILTIVSTEEYVPDFAFLVHKMVKMNDIDVIFALARMGKKIYVVARSRIPEVDVGAVARLMGGGGHPYAAAASIKGETLAQTEHRLLEHLYKNVHSRRLARDMMSTPAITINADATCKEASELINRYSVNALVTVSKDDAKGMPVGYITRQVVEKALFHELGQVPVNEYMTTEIAIVGPESDLPEVQDKIIENKQRILPVIKDHALLGVITRTDLLTILGHQSQRLNASTPDPFKGPVRGRSRSVAKFMRERLSKRIMEMLKALGEVADTMGYNAYVVGGFVRDLFLYRANEDIDVVIEGDGIQFAKQYAQTVNARIHSHNKFGTAVVIFPDGFKIDIASARMEYYKFPAALPVVEMSSIKLDLFRRDFTINTLCIRLNPEQFGILIDFFSAQRDIKDRVIRVLHNLSFVEDPTRVFRAIRFEQRFGFSIGKLTAGLIKNAVKMDFFKRLSGRRVLTELKLILEEENPSPAIMRLNDYQLLSVIHPSMELNNDLINVLNATRNVLSWHDLLFIDESYMKWIVYLLGMTRLSNKKVTAEICDRLELAPRYRNIFLRKRFKAEAQLNSLERRVPVKNSTLHKKLSVFRTELLLFMMAATQKEGVKKAISHYYTQLRPVKILIRGKDLHQMGFKPGPVYRQIMDDVLKAKLNGKLRTRADELRFARKYIVSC